MTTTGYRFTHNRQYAGYSDQVVQSPRSGGIAGDCPIRDLFSDPESLEIGHPMNRSSDGRPG